jgi:hypothetical protein
VCVPGNDELSTIKIDPEIISLNNNKQLLKRAGSEIEIELMMELFFSMSINKFSMLTAEVNDF